MKNFIAVVHKDEDSAYGVHFPDVPGCFSAADEQEDILSNAVEALALHLEGENIPEARGIEDLREEVKDDIAEGAFLMAIPFVNTVNKQTRVNISMDAGILSAIDKVAGERNLTRSAFLARAALNEIEGRH
ncbi:MAG: CopG family transcriptional regulator [Sulfitobacter sp.]|nr:MAG: CopG family transcriptional regulator [Sulfitobacter sp.]